ncbi:hypothetical protein [Neisseria dentiae]|uniref:DUF6911 family protein n=1 Tax=Neisseria dentiae TaxID=194197 RepID=UPI00359F455E
MKNLNFGGYGILDSNERVQFPHFINPTREIIDEIVSKTVEYNRGLIGISINPEPDIGIFQLTVEYDSGNYLPLLSMYLDDGDTDIKNWIEPKNKGKNIDIGGYFYPCEFTTKNLQVIKNLLITFIEDSNLLIHIMK